jgi:hypothetical protein
MKQVLLAVLLALGIGAAFIASSGISAAGDNQGCYKADAPTGTP